MVPPTRRTAPAAGFSLVETLVAASLLAIALAALAELAALAVRTNATARDATMSSTLAQRKLEELRGLAWGGDTLGLPASDLTTDTAASPETPHGGTGLAPSPPDTLTENRGGYVDYLDARGRPLGGGDAPPADTLVLQVFVTRRPGRTGRGGGPPVPAPDEALLVGLRTRTVP